MTKWKSFHHLELSGRICRCTSSPQSCSKRARFFIKQICTYIKLAFKRKTLTIHRWFTWLAIQRMSSFPTTSITNWSNRTDTPGLWKNWPNILWTTKVIQRKRVFQLFFSPQIKFYWHLQFYIRPFSRTFSTPGLNATIPTCTLCSTRTWKG